MGAAHCPLSPQKQTLQSYSVLPADDLASREPSKVGKTQSHGCVRLTNWDALQTRFQCVEGD